MVEEGIPGHPGASQARKGRDSLGRRDGAALRSSSRPLLWTPRPDARGAWHRSALPLQPDLGHHQSRSTGHKSAPVSRWLAKHAARIQLFWLPSYSPELNPDELLNQDVKTNALGRVRPIDQQELMGNVRSYLRITQSRPQLVQHYFRERHGQYAAL